MQPTPEPEELRQQTKRLETGRAIDRQQLLEWLVERHFHSTSAVELPGEFSVRGALVDIFAPDEERPVRVEFFGDEVASLRRFDVASQRSLETLEGIDVTAPGSSAGQVASLADFLDDRSWLLLLEPSEIQESAHAYWDRLEQHDGTHQPQAVIKQMQRFANASATRLAVGSPGPVCQLQMESVERFSGEIAKVRSELDRVGQDNHVFVVIRTEAEIERLQEIFQQTELAARGGLHFVRGGLSEGFRLVPERVALITGDELFHRGSLRRVPRRRLGKAIDSFLDLRAGDLVVHLAHGIGRYRGLKLLDKEEQTEEHLEIEFHGNVKVYVPATKINLVQKYVGGAKSRPALARIGGRTWLRQTQAAESAVLDLASEMLDMQAARRSRPGIAFAPDSEWQHEFDASFPYQETDDQLAAAESIKNDMEQTRPMDRLLCGDVGFGKTELAMRAAFKAVDSGYQVAVLAPTTILVEQHYRTFQERMAEFPFDIARLSRFCTGKQQREIVEGLVHGRIDVVVGTHRLVSNDVRFHNLGLIVIDEEQRFGVEVKEKLKALRATVDVLTMTATPIPRTLHMSLVGLRDISNLETPPDDRVAVETRVNRFNPELIRHAVLRELNRGGQIFFIHNRVQDIHVVAAALQRIVPEASIRIAHGQMPEGELERVMVDFVAERFDLLLATTIVESGLDIPTVNTIFINEADRYGLADLHQLRGRVGRYKHRAYCHLLIEPHKLINPNAARRLRAIEEFSELGAGFALAMRDLEIRGAGNLLGSQQSGHIAAVGYELYCQLLENAVRSLQRMPPQLTIEVEIDLPGEAYLPTDYVPDMRLKIDLYRRLVRVTSGDQLAEYHRELIDRFGQPPPQVRRLLAVTELRFDATLWSIAAIRREDSYLVFHYTDRNRAEHLERLSKGRLRVVDDQTAYLNVPQGVADPDQLIETAKSVLRPT